MINSCPDNFWAEEQENKSIWKRVLHVLESIDYWLTDFTNYDFPELFEGYSAEMDQKSISSVPKNKMIRYKSLIEEKLHLFFENIDDSVLLKYSSKHPQQTYLDIILIQIRHIQINVGYCNQSFHYKGLKAPEWLGKNEQSEIIKS